MAKVLITAGTGNYQVNLLGLSGSEKLERRGEEIYNAGTVPLFAKNLSTKEVYVIQPQTSLRPEVDCRILYGNLYLKYMSGLQPGALPERIFNFYQSLRMKTDILDLMTDRVQYMDFMRGGSHQQHQASNLCESMSQPQVMLGQYEPFVVDAPAGGSQTMSSQPAQPSLLPMRVFDTPGQSGATVPYQSFVIPQRPAQRDGASADEHTAANRDISQLQGGGQAWRAPRPAADVPPAPPSAQDDAVMARYQHDREMRQLADGYLSMPEDTSQAQRSSGEEAGPEAGGGQPRSPKSPSSFTNVPVNQSYLDEYQREYEDYARLKKQME